MVSAPVASSVEVAAGNQHDLISTFFFCLRASALRTTTSRRILFNTVSIRLKSCSHTLTTRHPLRVSLERCRRSRSTVSLIFSFHQCRFFLGFLKCRGQPCQKHPSTKTHSLSLKNTMSAVHLNSGRGLTSERNCSLSLRRAVR